MKWNTEIAAHISSIPLAISIVRNGAVPEMKREGVCRTLPGG
jgi:hypothetical protein